MSDRFARRRLSPSADLDFHQISPSYFRAIRVPLLKGRFFDDGDREGSEPVAIINEADAGRDPLVRAARVALGYLGSGLAFGLAAAWVLTALVAGFLFQIQPHEP